MGDLWRVKLDPPEAELAQLRRRASQLKERGGQSGQGGRGQGEDATRGPVCPRARFWRDGGGEEGGASGCNISAGPSTSLLGGARGQSRSGSGSGAGKEEEEEEEEGPGGAQGGGKQGVPTDEQDVAAPGFGAPSTCLGDLASLLITTCGPLTWHAGCWWRAPAGAQEAASCQAGCCWPPVPRTAAAAAAARAHPGPTPSPLRPGWSPA